jgi:hypothetical protein
MLTDTNETIIAISFLGYPKTRIIYITNKMVASKYPIIFIISVYTTRPAVIIITG